LRTGTFFFRGPNRDSCVTGAGDWCWHGRWRALSNGRFRDDMALETTGSGGLLCMALTPLFNIGRCEVSPAAGQACLAAGIDPGTLFARHAGGDWGDTPDWLCRDNGNAARLELASHAIRS